MYSEDKNDGAWYVQCFFLPPLPPHDYTFLAVANNANRTNIFRSCYYTLNLLPTPWRKGMVWPIPYMNAMARAIWTKGVDVEIVLSNPGSRPDNLPLTEAQYGNGW